MLKTLESGLNKVETWLVCAGLLILIFTVFAAAVLRFFGVDMSVSTDLAQLVFAWVSFIGADLAMRKDKHMGVDMLITRFPVKLLNAIYLFNYLLILFFLLFAVRYGINLCIVNAARNTRHFISAIRLLRQAARLDVALCASHPLSTLCSM